MSEELGKIERLPVEEFGKGRKLLFVPLVFGPPGTEEDLAEKVRAYWEQAGSNVANLESKLGKVQKVFHELVPFEGEQGVKALKDLNGESHALVQDKVAGGAEFEALEDREVLAEFMDWSRCVSVGLQSQTALTKVYDFYTEAYKKRNEQMGKRLDETLKDGEIGLLIMREGHHVQFAQDIQVFYVSPPGLDDIKRWLRDQEAQIRKAAEEAASAGGAVPEEEAEENPEG